MPKAAQTIGFTESEEAFFRVGEEPAALADSVEDDYEEQPSLWRRLFSRTQSA